MTIRDALAQAAFRLIRARVPHAARDADLLCAHALKKDRSYVIARATDAMPAPQMRAFDRLCARRARHEPIAYILEVQPFYGRNFFVNRHTLIPRAETELIIDTLKSRMPKGAETDIVDIGTGSGAIAITAALELPRARVYATDLSHSALKAARKNARALNCASRIRFAQGNLLDPLIPLLTASPHASAHTPLCLLANLPYLASKQYRLTEKQIRLYEPACALTAGADGLRWYRLLFQQIKKTGLMPAVALCEIDPAQKRSLPRLIRALYPHAQIEIIPDMAARPRLVCVSF